MLVKTYGRWLDSESSKELEHIWTDLQNMTQIAPNLPHESIDEVIAN